MAVWSGNDLLPYGDMSTISEKESSDIHVVTYVLILDSM